MPEYSHPSPGIWLPYKSGSYYSTNQPPSGDSTTPPVLNRVTYHAWPVWSNCVIDQMTLGVATAGTAGAKVRLGIFATDANGRPGTLVLDAGTINGDSNTYQVASGTFSQALIANTLYWVAVVWQVQAVGSGALRASGLGAGSAYVTVSANSSDPRVCAYTEAGVTGAFPVLATPVDTQGVTQTPAVKVRFV